MSNVTTYFELERDATIKWLDFIEGLNSDDWNLDEEYERLYSGDAWDKAGSSEFWAGAIGLIFMVAIFLLSMEGDSSLLLLIALGVATCLYKMAQGFFRFRRSRSIRRRFTEKRDELETEPGWFWRYENFIRPELHTFPEFAQASFDGVVQSSRERSFEDDQESLIRYWFWVRIVRDRLQVWREASNW